MCVLCKLKYVRARASERFWTEIGRLQRLLLKNHNFYFFVLYTWFHPLWKFFFFCIFGVWMDSIFGNRRFTLCTWYGFDSVPIFGWNDKSGSLSLFVVFFRLRFNIFHYFKQNINKNRMDEKKKKKKKRMTNVSIVTVVYCFSYVWTYIH